MTDTEIRELADAFVELPRAERRAKYFSLDVEVRRRVRKIVEARRGIAYRAEGGVPVFTKEAYIAQITQQSTKLAELPKRMEALKTNIVELKKQLLENWGEGALEEAETALENLANQ